MTDFKNYLSEKGIDACEIEQFLADLNIEWDRSKPEGEVFFDLYPITLHYNGNEKPCESYLSVDKYEFVLYRMLELPQEKNVDLSRKWIAFRIRKNPQLFDEYKSGLVNELENAKKIKKITQDKIKEEYSTKKANLDKQYLEDMEASNFATERLSNILKCVQESKSENEYDL